MDLVVKLVGRKAGPQDHSPAQERAGGPAPVEFVSCETGSDQTRVRVKQDLSVPARNPRIGNNPVRKDLPDLIDGLAAALL